ncbi:GHMP family kinase ATP-binding protein [Carboxydothermus ferrireducens]|uniref:L-threonine kinase n=1 Tax=Carboxydothermus ferrireducens DSM 11255 TaxID=1119529 RepID=A0ABX2R937_9THEO|nr:hypothetical protein [Carboxydothermus ferrireducens]NYE56651.1 L-threonine kinase [Carboxydothermus ferrireducens DSM 11255]
MKIKAYVCGTAGELVQGSIGGKDFLLTAPVNIGNTVEIALNEKLDIPEDRPKIKRLVEIFYSKFSIKHKFTIKVTRNLPEGRGMGSSTADLAGSLAGMLKLSGIRINRGEFLKILTQVEPTDGSFLPGISLVDHRRGSFWYRIAAAKNYKIFWIDTGKAVDTIAFNRREDLKELNRLKEPKVRQALKMVFWGLKTDNPYLFGWGVTVDAFAHQLILPKEELFWVYRVGKELGAVGVNVAHSGSGIGLWFHNSWSQEKEEILRKEFSSYTCRVLTLVDGGITLEVHDA